MPPLDLLATLELVVPPFRLCSVAGKEIAYHSVSVSVGLSEPRVGKRSQPERRFLWIIRGSGTFFGQRVFP